MRPSVNSSCSTTAGERGLTRTLTPHHVSHRVLVLEFSATWLLCWLCESYDDDILFTVRMKEFLPHRSLLIFHPFFSTVTHPALAFHVICTSMHVLLRRRLDSPGLQGELTFCALCSWRKCILSKRTRGFTRWRHRNYYTNPTKPALGAQF